MNLINPAGSNDIRSFVAALKSALSDFYNTEDQDTNLDKLYTALATVLKEADFDISSLLNDNFLSVTEPDELIARGTDKKDKLRQVGAFEIDRIGFTPSSFIRREIHRIESTETTVTLQYIPVDITQVRIYNSRNRNQRRRVPVSLILDTDVGNNTITVAGVDTPGDYIFEYLDSGNVTSEQERIVLPKELFDFGWNDGGFGQLGFGV